VVRILERHYTINPRVGRWVLCYNLAIKKGAAMEITLKAIETTGVIDRERRLLLDEPLPITGPSRVRVIILVTEDTDVTEQEWLAAASTNPSFDFLKEPVEDIYTLSDGKPFDDQG
jgi:hypothetical protein